jgi:hypothetical protein
MNDEEVLSTPAKAGILERLNPFKSNKQPIIPIERQTCPEHTAGFFSLLTFSWMSSIMAVSLFFHIFPFSTNSKIHKGGLSAASRAK